MSFSIASRNSRWPPKSDIFEKWPVDTADTLRVKTLVKIALSRTVSEINVFLHFMKKFKMAAFLHFMQKFKMAAKNGGTPIIRKRHQYTLQVPWGSKISSKLL